VIDSHCSGDGAEDSEGFSSSAGVTSALVTESPVSALPLPHESSLNTSAASGNVGLLMPFALDLVRVIDGDGASVCFGESRVPVCMGLAALSKWGDMDRGESIKPRHLRQPSKSIRACMQPHSVTFCESQGKPTGYRTSQYKK